MHLELFQFWVETKPSIKLHHILIKSLQLPDDGHRTVDLSLRRSQDTKGVSSDWLHQTHPRWRCLSAQQQQILPQ